MPQRKVVFAPEEYYHIYNRGNSKQIIFHDDQDRVRFLELLFLSNASGRFNIYDIKKNREVFDFDRTESLVGIGAYTLMPNHFHILIKEGSEGGISKFMKKLSTGYSMYYNQKYKRTGGLFEGKFKATHVTNDRYLKYLFSYIHLNSVKLVEPKWKEVGVKNENNAIKHINQYEWSSYIDYSKVKERPYSKILSRKVFPSYFSSIKALKEEIFGWLKYQSRGKTSRLILGVGNNE